MAIEIIQDNSWEWMQNSERKFDAIVTDYPYGGYFNLEMMKRICSGNIVTFCASEDHPFDPDERAYWVKALSTKNYSKSLGRFVEKIFVCRQGETFNAFHWSQMTGVYFDLVIEAKGHQWRKPLSLVERLIRIYTNPGDLVLDPFCGEGTILEACLNLNRNAVGIDVDKKWVDYCKEKFNGN